MSSANPASLFNSPSPITRFDALCDRIQDDCSLALAPDYSGCSMATVLEIIQRKTRRLRLIGVPQMGVQADWLIGAGCVASVEAAAVTLSEWGQAPRFVDAVQAGELHVLDSTCPVIHAGLQASEKGIPCMPLRGILGSDLVRHRSDWRVVNNPMANDEQDPILMVPAIRPDVALLHAPVADVHGNVWIGIRRELMLMAHASVQTLVTVEKIQNESLLADDQTAAGTIPAMYVSAVAQVHRAADPVGLFGCYDADASTLSSYAHAARDQAGFDAWMAVQLDSRLPVGVES